MKIKDFQDVTIFFIQPKQSIIVLKNGASFNPCKYKYYENYISKNTLIEMVKHLIKQGDINVNELKKE